ncbi:TIGR02391 family protein [Microvirga sp. G4-2]|uniref:TIGR02391 family protein n=1 Tax=Microvirga sp. G4-2 TaxID=3434467 RepID=UPI004043C185
MRLLAQIIPDADTVLALEPEELSAKVLFLLKQHYRDTQFHPGNFINEIAPGSSSSPYPTHRLAEIAAAVSEAFAWLEGQALIVPVADNSNRQSGWRQLSRRAKRLETETEVAAFAMASHVAKANLHPTIAQTVWMAFIRGEFDVAVFQAMKAVEVAVREAAHLPANVIGVRLMRDAFHPETGALRDQTSELSEREALSNLFAGAIGSYKNPHSHRNVTLNDPREAFEIIMLANHLLRIVDSRRS